MLDALHEHGVDVASVARDFRPLLLYHCLLVLRHGPVDRVGGERKLVSNGEHFEKILMRHLHPRRASVRGAIPKELELRLVDTRGEHIQTLLYH